VSEKETNITEEILEEKKELENEDIIDTIDDIAEEDMLESEETEKKSLFGKKKEKKDKKDVQIEELTDKVKRQMAEFENFRKRTEKEKSAMYEIGAKNIIEKFLPIVDNFERGLQQLPEGAEEDSFVEGMNMIYKQLLTTLEGLEVKPIEALNQEFNQEYHNAVMHVEDEEVGANIIVEEFQKGYTYRSNVIRHSMVKVAN
jgi:Molecular chaperone GrpE (heat shock protein)